MTDEKEVTAYRLNELITWEEFKKFPDDIKIQYIKLLRHKFNVPDIYIGKAMGTSKDTIRKEMQRLGISVGKCSGGRRIWDKEGFDRFCEKTETETVDQVEQDEVVETIMEETCEPIIPEPVVHENDEPGLIPCSGSMTFNGEADEILKTVMKILGKSSVYIRIQWDEKPETKMAVI